MVTLIADGESVHLSPSFQVGAAVDPSNAVQLLTVDSSKALRVTTTGLALPQYDTFTISYVGSTNNINTIVYSLAGTTVATLTLAYVGGTPSANDATIASGTLI